MKNTLLITLTRKCQLDCEYCKMDNQAEDIKESDLYKAVDLVNTSVDPKIQFFGGEPLMRFDLIKKAILYSESLYPLRTRYSVTTNGLLLTDEMMQFFKRHGVEVMFSLDGATQGFNEMRGLGAAVSTVIEKIQACKKSGVNYFINMVITPASVSQMFKMFKSILEKEIENIKVSYVLGSLWDAESQEMYLTNLSEISKYCKVNNVPYFDSLDDEPVFASPTAIVDTDGELYVGCSIVLERQFPELHQSFHVGNLSKIMDISEIASSYESQILKIIRCSLPEKKKEILLNNLELGLKIRKSIQSCQSLELHLSSRCNLDCNYCDLDRSIPDMDVDTLHYSLDFFLKGASKDKRLQFFGGEPLVRFDLIKEAVEYLDGEKVEYYIATNGLLLNEEICEFLHAHNFFVILSIDGDRRTQESNRPKYDKGGDPEEYPFDRILNSVELLLKWDVAFSINMVVCPDNVIDFYKNYSFLSRLGCKNIKASYSIGEYWENDKIKEYWEQVKRVLIDFGGSLDFNIDEPTIASDSLVVDGKGDIYRGCTLSSVKNLPSFKKINFVGNIKDMDSIDEIYHDHVFQTYILSTASYGTALEYKVVMNNLDFGVSLKLSDLDKSIFWNINHLPQNPRINSLMLMITYLCQMDCTYCNVKQKNTSMSKEMIDDAITFLMTSESDTVQLRLWGGEPLLMPDLIKHALESGDSQAKAKTKEIKYMITTNGFDIDKVSELINRKDVELMISLDGGTETNLRFRPLKGSELHKKIVDNIGWVVSNNINHFVSMTVTPTNVGDLLENFRSIVDLGVKRIQVCFASTIYWDKDKIFRLMRGLESIKSFCADKDVVLLNMGNDAEPSMLSDEIIVDCDGKMYYDIAIFHEKKFPWLRESVYLGSVAESGKLQDLYHTKKDILQMILGAGKSKLISNNVETGLVLKEFIDNRLNPPLRQTETNRFFKFLYYTANEQRAFVKKYGLGLESYILHLSNPCENDCIFCKNKPVFISSLDYIDYRVSGNNLYSKVSIVGNEPLNHPYIKRILNLCKRNGFEEVELMTSGMYLKNKSFVEFLHEAGVNAVSIPIYSTQESVHDLIVQRRGDYKDLMAAIENVRKLGITLYLHTNLLSQNIDDMNELEKFSLTKTDKFVILPVREKASNIGYPEIVPSFKEMIQKLKVKSLVGYPLCVIGRIQDHLKPNQSQISDAMKVYLLDQRFVKIKKCQDCSIRKYCPGMFKEMIKIFGDEDICPR